MSETDKRTATQRIEDLEKIAVSNFQTNDSLLSAVETLQPLLNDVALIKEAMRLLNNKTEAIIQSAKPETGISAESVTAAVVKMNIVALKTQVDQFLAAGTLVPTDVVTSNSYLVCERADSNGVIVDGRVQFRLDGQNADTVALFTGKKVGDVLDLTDQPNAKILEIYDIVDPKAPEAPAADQPAAEAAAAPQAAEAQAEAPAAAESPAAPAAEAAPAAQEATAPAADDQGPTTSVASA